MADIALIRYYNDIKDESWPDIKTYADFLKLPDRIKHECYEVHNFSNRLEEIESSDYWNQQYLISGYCFKDLLFVDNQKCAGTYYREFFKSIGWSRVDINKSELANYRVFGIVMHPLQRHVKGVAQLLSHGYCDYREDDWKEGKLCFEEIVSDLNTKRGEITSRILSGSEDALLPYSEKFNDHLYDIDWIPWDYGNVEQFKTWIEMLLHSNNIDVTIPRNDKLAREAYPAKREAYSIIEQMLLEADDNHKFRLYRYYADDLKFYHRLLEQFNPEGKTWEEISWLTNH